MYLVYILKSENYSYIGMTNDFFRRWKQHNRILKGGAKYTSKREYWTPVCIIDGFKTKCEAMQCEWKLKRVKGVKNRILNLIKILKHMKIVAKPELGILCASEHIGLALSGARV